MHKNTVRCLKGKDCKGMRDRHIHYHFMKLYALLMHNALSNKKWYVRDRTEPQYQFIEPRIIVEKDIITGNHDIGKDVTRWYMSNDVPVLVSQQCEDSAGKFGSARKWYSSRYEPLPVSTAHYVKICPYDVAKPRTWDRQRRIVERLGRRLPRGVVRIDLYAGDRDIFFSEFTFTTGACDSEYTFKPAVAGGLLYAVHHGLIPAEVARRPEYVENVIGGMGSWCLAEVDKNKGISLQRMKFRGANNTRQSTSHFPSPLDLCDHYVDEYLRGATVKREPDYCSNIARRVSNYTLRCMNVDKKGELSSYGMHRHPTMKQVAKKLAWYRISTMVVILLVMFLSNFGSQKDRATTLLFNLALALGIAHLHSRLYGYGKLNFSPRYTLKESYNMFHSLRPFESKIVSTIRLVTSWVYLTPWLAKTPRRALFCWLAIDVIVKYICEWSNQYDPTDLRCISVAFINRMPGAAGDTLFRQFILEPLFVYVPEKVVRSLINKKSLYE